MHENPDQQTPAAVVGDGALNYSDEERLAQERVRMEGAAPGILQAVNLFQNAPNVYQAIPHLLPEEVCRKLLLDLLVYDNDPSVCECVRAAALGRQPPLEVPPNSVKHFIDGVDVTHKGPSPAIFDFHPKPTFLIDTLTFDSIRDDKPLEKLMVQFVDDHNASHQLFIGSTFGQYTVIFPSSVSSIQWRNTEGSVTRTGMDPEANLVMATFTYTGADLLNNHGTRVEVRGFKNHNMEVFNKTYRDWTRGIQMGWAATKEVVTVAGEIVDIGAKVVTPYAEFVDLIGNQQTSKMKMEELRLENERRALENQKHAFENQKLENDLFTDARE